MVNKDIESNNTIKKVIKAENENNFSKMEK